MSHWAIRICSNRRQGVWGWPAGFAPRSLAGRPATALSNPTWALPPLSSSNKWSRSILSVAGGVLFTGLGFVLFTPAAYRFRYCVANVENLVRIWSGSAKITVGVKHAYAGQCQRQ